jgi:hypothetical protein
MFFHAKAYDNYNSYDAQLWCKHLDFSQYALLGKRYLVHTKTKVKFLKSH